MGASCGPYSLEGAWCIALAKEHDKRFKKPKRCFEGCLPLVALLDAHIVVSPADVKLGEEHVPFQIAHEHVDVRQQVHIAYCPFVQLLVVLDGPQHTIFLFDEEEWGGIS